jgi:hypothetical protein
MVLRGAHFPHSQHSTSDWQEVGMCLANVDLGMGISRLPTHLRLRERPRDQGVATSVVKLGWATYRHDR